MKLYTFTLVFAGVATMAEAGFWKNDFSCTAGDDFDGMNSNLASLPALSTPHPNDPSKCYLRLGDDTLGTSAASAFIPYTLNTARTFSTTFEYRMFGDNTPADGITFTMHQDSRGVNALGSTGGNLGVYDTNAIQNALVIELDTYGNGQEIVPQVEIQTTDNTGQNSGPLAVKKVNNLRTTATTPGRVWIDYCEGVLKVFVSPSGGAKPATPELSHAIDLSTFFASSDVFMGFTAGTASKNDNHDIISWGFTDGCSGSPDVDGDPHFLTWNNTFYDFMGACDLKLITAPYFAPGLVLDIDIRTTIRYAYSYVESAAVRIGDSILEVSSFGQYTLDGVSGAELPALIAGFTIEQSQPFDKVHMFEIHLEEGESIVIKVFKDMVAVKLQGASGKRYHGSLGMLGSFDNEGLLLARDGATILDDPNAFAAEWQIKSDEALLFQTQREPQYPQACQMPSTTEQSRRKLGESLSIEAAEIACAKWPKGSISGCVHDVLATGDLEFAQAGAF